MFWKASQTRFEVMNWWIHSSKAVLNLSCLPKIWGKRTKKPKMEKKYWKFGAKKERECAEEGNEGAFLALSILFEEVSILRIEWAYGKLDELFPFHYDSNMQRNYPQKLVTQKSRECAERERYGGPFQRCQYTRRIANIDNCMSLWKDRWIVFVSL